MGIEKRFIEDAMTRYKVSNYLEKELDKAGFSRVEIQRTPVVTRIAVEVTNPGRVIGRKGKTIQDLTNNIHNIFKIDNPQLSVIEVRNESLHPKLVAKKVCRYIEMGKKARAILHFALKEIMESGALGAEIVASGKIAAKGGRSKRLRLFAGYIPKAGEPARLVTEGHVTAYPKSGAIGVLVRIVQPGTVFPDKTPGQKISLPKTITAAEDVQRAPREEIVKEQQKSAQPPRYNRKR